MDAASSTCTHATSSTVDSMLWTSAVMSDRERLSVAETEAEVDEAAARAKGCASRAKGCAARAKGCGSKPSLG